jgi:GT2 family glycosyltransferase
MSNVVAVLLTCHNRKTTSLACLSALFAQVLPPEYALDVYLVDDGSTDGTGDAIRAMFPDVTVIAGDGSLFWSGGMTLAWRHAARASPAFYLWLNDDTNLLPGGLATLLKTWEDQHAAGLASGIVVGSCCDPVTGEHSYGGVRMRDAHPGRLDKVVPDPVRVIRCDTFEGNLVLIPKTTFEVLGIARTFRHSIMDNDYGLFAKRHRIPVIIAPGILAECALNPIFECPHSAWQDRRLPRTLRWKKLVDRKGLPPADWWRFLWAHARLRAFLYWPVPYVRVWLGL